MKTQSRIKLVVAVVSTLILFVSLVSFPLAREGWTTAAMFPESEATFEFTNDEIEDAYDLHIKWGRAVKVTAVDPFKNKEGSGTAKTDLSNGVVKKTEKASVTVTWDGTEPKVEEWWWTKKGGGRLGKVKEGNPTTARAPATPSSTIREGLRIVTFDASQGRVTVNLPVYMTAGDTISGTVLTEPKGNTPEEKAKNQDQLNGYVVEFAGTKTPASQPSFKWTLPEPLPGQPRYQLRIIDITTSRTIATAEITPYPKITQTAPPTSANITPPIPHVNIPSLGQSGRPIVVSGPFDGDSSNTSFNWTVAGSTTPNGLTVLAESQGEAVVAAPTNVVGPIEIHLKEGGVETSGQFRNVGVNLTAPKTSLLKGESTELKVQVNGLEGIKEPVPLTLQCTGVITMEGGIYQPLVIQPSQVSSDGRYTTTRGITGVQAGGWGATATVVTGPFNVCLQDASRAATVILWNTVSGDYSFRPPGGSAAPPTGGAPPLTGKGTMVMKGCILTLNHNAPDRRVFATLDTCTNTGKASVESSSPKETFTITDRNTTDNTCGPQ